MAVSTTNNAANVSTGKGVAGGYMFVAPAGSTLPTDLDTELDAAFLNFGYLGEDGVSFSDSFDSTNRVDMNGDAVDTSAGEVEKSFTTKFLEIKKTTLALVNGTANVTDENGVITTHDKGPVDETWAVVFELLLKNGRRIIESCRLGELGDETFNYSELVGREITMAMTKGATTGDYKTDYIESTETEKPLMMSAKTAPKARAKKTD